MNNRLEFFREKNKMIENNQAKKNIPGKKRQLKKPKPLPDTFRNIERDSVYKILHPYEFN